MVARVREVRVPVGGDDRAWRPGWCAACARCEWKTTEVGKSIAVDAAVAHWRAEHVDPRP